jgi:hypothetical protein
LLDFVLYDRGTLRRWGRDVLLRGQREKACAQVLQPLVKKVVGQPWPVVIGQSTQSSGKVGTNVLIKIEIVYKYRNDITLRRYSALNLAPYPILWLLAPLKRAVSQYHEEVPPVPNLMDYGLIKPTTVKILRIQKYVVIVLAQVLANKMRERPTNLVTITNENGGLRNSHILILQNIAGHLFYRFNKFLKGLYSKEPAGARMGSYCTPLWIICLYWHFAFRADLRHRPLNRCL